MRRAKPKDRRKILARVLYRITTPVRRPEGVMFLPALTLGGFWMGGEGALIAVALLIPLFYALAGILAPPPTFGGAQSVALDPTTGLVARDGVVTAAEVALSTSEQKGFQTACFIVRLDDAELLAERHGRQAEAQILRRTGERLCGVMRQDDVVGRLDGGIFAVILHPVTRLDLEVMLQLSARLQEAVAAPVSIDAATLHVTASIGFCQASQAPEDDANAFIDAAEAAALEARRNGPGAVRAYTSDIRRIEAARHTMRGELQSALDSGAIRAFYQPQLSTDTGAISGMEALVRWDHPERGLLLPDEFLPVLNDAGLSDRLGEVMLFNALNALRGWDRAGLEIPTVSVNFSPEELRNPRLADKIAWELDRFGIAPARLIIEILETVAPETDNDVILRNITRLATLGCGIDLDDFGTGHASIGNIRRLAVTRIKIDRSLITRVDRDREQQRTVAAVLSMAEHLDIQTLAEGVETLGEHAILAQLGCRHVQGFAIARPMPFDDTIAWAERHRAKLGLSPQLGGQAR
jgi:diguanylate cyclase (GGDEF)-like protein